MSIQSNFERFHEENPHVYERLTTLALNLRRKGYGSYGMKGLFEVMRWMTAMKTTGSKFKLNNNYTAHYARMIMDNNPELKGFFNIRTQSHQQFEERECFSITNSPLTEQYDVHVTKRDN